MKQQIPVAAAVVIAVVVGLAVVVFGWRKVSGSGNDVTQETINRYQDISKQRFGGAGGNGAGPGQMTHGAPPANLNNPPPTTAGSSH